MTTPPEGAEGLLGHLQKSELGTQDLPHFLHALLAVALALQGGIPEHHDKPLDGGAQRVLRRLCGPYAQVYGQKKNPGDSPGESAKGRHAMSPLVEGGAGQVMRVA